MRKFGWTFPMAGLAVSVGGLMAGALSGQSPPPVQTDQWSAVELLAPEFDAEALPAFQTPVLELGLVAEPPTETEAKRSDLPIIEPWKPAPAVSLPVIVPNPALPAPPPMAMGVETSELPAALQRPSQPREPDWMQGLDQPVLAAEPTPIPAGSPEAPWEGLPPLPNPTQVRPGHSRCVPAVSSRPGHSAPKRSFEPGLGH
jgi:hypothetical protein